MKRIGERKDCNKKKIYKQDANSCQD